MTDLLKQLLHRYGLLYITIVQLEKERPGGEHASLKDYYDSLGPALPGEPTLVVKVSGDGETRFVKNFTGPDLPQRVDRGDVTLMELPEDEFYFFRAWRQGLFDLNKGIPPFILEMSLVYAYVLFETYASDIFRLRLKAHPAQLGMNKQVTLAEILASSDKNSLLDALIERELYQLMHEPLAVNLTRLREQLGLRKLRPTFDEALIKLSLTRNCLMHNAGLVDSKLARADPSLLVGEKIAVTSDYVHRAINTFKGAAIAIDAALPLNGPSE